VIQLKRKPDGPSGSRGFKLPTLPALIAFLAFAGALTGGAAPKKTTVTTKPTPPAAQAVPAAPVPGAREMKQLSFLSGKWEGKLESYAMTLDISINGQFETPANLMKFKIHAVPATGIKLGIEGDYNSVVSYSTRHGSLRAVLTDVNGRGVEMLGEKVEDQPEWLFNSTGDGAPFPFKVRLRPVTSDQVVVNYASGGRLALKYEVTFNRVPS
jgi:hypothetical protein